MGKLSRKHLLVILLVLSCVGCLTSCRENCEEEASAKPVIYLYPESETDVTVRLDYAGELTCTYPDYKDGWKVSAGSDGTLTDADGQTYNYLYWEGVNRVDYDFSEGFCVAGSDTAVFLEDALSRLGLTRREANEFIDTLLRVFMAWKPLESPVEIPTQNLTAPERTGFTVVEWGGCQVK